MRKRANPGYIYKKSVGGKFYYYLRASERKGDKVVVKDIAYLGNTLEKARKKLNKLPSHSAQISALLS